MDIGNEMYKLAEELYPIGRSLTGEGVRNYIGHIKTGVAGIDNP